MLKCLNPVKFASQLFNRVNIKINKGFTLLEAILAIFVTLVGVLGAYGLSQQILAYSSLSNSKFTAAYLAKEGIEIVRNIRDTNWVEEELWDNGLTSCSAGCEADYDDPILSAFSNNYLVLLNGVQTKYKRRITITPTVDAGGNDILQVSSEVFWQEKGKPYNIIAQEILYEWWQ